MVSAGDSVEKTVKSKAKNLTSGNRKPNLNNQLRNTRLCKYFQETGSCKYGARCGFAHQEAELQSLPDLQKTRMCPKANCEDPNCPYAHADEELRATDFFFKTALCTWYGAGKCRNGASCRFAHGEEELQSVPGEEGDKAQNSKNGKQQIMEKAPKTQKSEKKASANKSKKASPDPIATSKSDESMPFSLPQGASVAGGFDPMFIRPWQVDSCMYSQPPGFTTLPQFNPYQHLAAPIPSIDYNAINQILSDYHYNNIASMVEAQQQAAWGQLGQTPELIQAKTKSTYAGLNFDPGLATPPAMAGSHLFPPGLDQHAIPNDSASWEISELAEHIKTLGEQVSKLQQSISQNPENPQAMKGGHVSETTKSGSGSFEGHSSSQGSGSSGDASPPGSPQEGNNHPDKLHTEAAHLSFALQRFVAAQGTTLYP